MPDHVAAAIGEAVPGFEPAMVAAVWFGPGHLVGVDLRVGDQELNFKVSAFGQILWVGRPGGAGLHALPAPDADGTGADSSAAIERIEDLPERVAEVVRRLAPHGTLVAARVIGGRQPAYEVHLENPEGGTLDLLVKGTGLVVAMERDTDADGLHDAREVELGIDPERADSDGDFYPDGFEVDHGSAPDHAGRTPSILDLRYDRRSRVVILSLQTFDGGAFFIESSAADDRNDRGGHRRWTRLGEPIFGDGGVREIAVPADGFYGSSMFRAGIVEPGEGGDAPPAEGSPNASEAPCTVPASLVARELLVEGGKRLCFKSGRRGEVIEGGGGGMIITPFAYTFKKSGHCKAKVTLTFNTPQGFEVTIYELTFGNGGATGAYIANEIEAGDIEDSFSGDFTLSFND